MRVALEDLGHKTPGNKGTLSLVLKAHLQRLSFHLRHSLYLTIDVSSTSAPLWLLATTYSPKVGQLSIGSGL
jgi:hypothetical protein